jgi:diacylglycerol kinase (ATP)
MERQDPERRERRKNHGGFGRLLGALRNSWSGLRLTWKAEAAFRQEVVAFALLAPIALIAPVTAIERLLLFGSLLLVLVVELINSAIEAVSDRVSLELHPLAKRAKDAASAAVLLALVLTAATWVTIWMGVIVGDR